MPNHSRCAVFQRNGGSNSTHYVAIFCPLISRKLESLAFIMIFLFCSTPEFRNAFLKTIRQIIRDSVRRMNLPVTNSQSYNGNGANSGTAPKRGICYFMTPHLATLNSISFASFSTHYVQNAFVMRQCHLYIVNWRKKSTHCFAFEEVLLLHSHCNMKLSYTHSTERNAHFSGLSLLLVGQNVLIND